MTGQHAAQGPEDLVRRGDLLAQSGLDFLRGMLEGRHAGAPMAGTMNIRLDQVERGRVVFRGAPRFIHANPVGAVHGGWYGAVLDSALGCAVMSEVPRGSWYTTLDYHVNITRALPIGAEALCEAIVQHAGRSTAVARAEIRGLADGRVYATGATTCIILQGG